MAHLEMSIKTLGGATVQQLDLTLHEFIPLVRQLTRQLEGRPGMADALEGYRVWIEPRCSGSPTEEETIFEPEPSDDGSAAAKDVVRISEDDVSSGLDANYDDEVRAYLQAGGHPLCSGCPEAYRCPGSGAAASRDLDGWIALDPACRPMAEAVRFFSLRLESAAGGTLYRRDFELSVLQPLISYLGQLLRSEKGLRERLRGDHRVVLHLRPGEPRTGSSLLGRRPFTTSEAPAPQVPEETIRLRRPASLVDWEALEGDGDNEEPLILDDEGSESLLSIRATWQVGEQVDGTIAISVHRRVVIDLADVRQQGKGRETSGLLVGSPRIEGSDAGLALEIAAAIPTVSPSGEPLSAATLYSVFLSAERQMKERYPDQEIVGWFRFRPSSGCGPEAWEEEDPPSRLSEEERLFHGRFFARRWQVALIAGASGDTLRFFSWQGRELVGSSGFEVIL